MRKVSINTDGRDDIFVGALEIWVKKNDGSTITRIVSPDNLRWKSN